MKKILASILISVLVLSFVTMTACKKEEEKPGSKLKVVLYLNGTLGDKSFFDSANRGIEMAIQDFGIEGKTIEGGNDSSRWEPDLEQLCQGDWDIIIAGTWQLQESLEKLAPKYPDKKFFTYDTSVDYSKGNLGNIYSILYKQNESSFLVGALAALVTTSDMPLANPEKIIGFLGGMDIPVINDFKVGYIQGAKYIDPEVQVLVSYAASYTDPAKGKELALAQYNQGADISFNVAGETGLGLLDAAKEMKKYAIGVDSDQYLMFKDSDPEKASYIVTSMMKNVDKSIHRAIKLHIEGKLPYGQAEALGIKEGGVGVADNENYRKVVTEEFRNKIKELEEKILNGEIVVETAFGE